MDSLRLSDLFQVYGRFYRSIQVQKDWQEGHSIEGYLPTPTAREIVQLILDNLAVSNRERAFAISGPFGTGKSAFLLFLADLLSNHPARHPENLSYQSNSENNLPRLFPILIVGERVSLSDKLRGGLLEQLGRIAPEEIDNLRSISAISLLYQRARAIVRDKGWDGVLVILDEFGKFLEYAALKPDEQDVFAMQQLAEDAVRSPDPFLLITVQHSSMADYLNIASDVQRMEWQKVQGRFKDITFLEPPAQLLSLLSRSIVPHLEDRSAAKSYHRVIDALVKNPAMAEAGRRFNLETVALELAPLHPLTALLLVVIFRSQLAQNERSLFAFLTSHEFFSFLQFLDNTEYAEPAPLYSPDQLYDYLVASLGGALYLGERSYLWRDIESHLQRLPASAPPLAVRLIKLVGLLTLYGPSIGVKPDVETLQLALYEVAPEIVVATLDSLEDAQVLLYRRLTEAYVLWEGVHVDLEVSAKEAALHLTTASMSKRLAAFLPAMPLIARAHYIQSGTLRFFAVEYRDGQDSVSPPDFGDADGVISYVLTTSMQERDILITRYQNITARESQLWIVAFPAPLQRVEVPLREAEIWEWVQSNDRQLEGDEGARREVVVRLGLAEDRLRFLLRESLDIAAIEWLYQGKTQQFAVSRRFHRWLSDLSNGVFSDAPALHNELLNRRRLSSAAVAARRALLEGMLTHEHESQLGFTKTPPEVSMYRSLLKAGGFHKPVGGKYVFGAPYKGWEPVWEAMRTFLLSTHAKRRPITDLYQELQAPPFGLRDGPLPVLLLTLLLVYRREVALYEDGLFVSDLRIEVLERLTRNPERYDIQQYPVGAEIEGVYQHLVEKLHQLEIMVADTDGGAPLIDVVRALVVTVAKLPTYARLTRRFDHPQIAAVRDTVLRAKDPYELLRVDLPNILGVAPDDRAFAEALHDALKALIQSYPHLLDLIERNIIEVFHLQGSVDDPFKRLRERALPLARYATDINLSLFLREVTTEVSRGDRREALGRAIARGKSPMQWNDSDVAAFKGHLLAVVSEFERLEALVLERDKEGVESVLRIDLLNGSLQESRAVVSVLPEQEEEVNALLSRLRDTLGEVTRDRVQLAALGRLIHEVLTHSVAEAEGE